MVPGYGSIYSILILTINQADKTNMALLKIHRDEHLPI